MRRPRTELEHRAAEDAPWMAIAHRYADLRERQGDQLNETVRGFFRHTRFPPNQINVTTAWCAAFVCAVLELAGVQSPRSARARDFLRWGQPLARPVYGAILIFRRGASADAGHVGFSAWPIEAAGDLWCYGGNQGNRVCTQPKKRESLIGVRWPYGRPLPPDGVLDAEPIES